ncbi:MAG: hypothetical protein U0871_00155 [Gemmataceae bacterium]
MSRTWWVHRLFARTARPTRRTRPGAKPAVTHLEDRTAPATLTESAGPLGQILTIDLDTAGELVTVASLGGVYQFTTTGTFTDGGVNAGNFTGLGTNSLTLDDSFAYAEVQFTDSQPGGALRFDDGGGNTFDQPFTVALDDPGSTVEFAGTTNFDANDLTVSAAGKVTQTGGDLTAGNLTVTGSLVDLTVGANTFFSVRGGATAGRFDLTTAAGFFVPGPGLAATGTIALTLNGGGTLAVLAPLVSDTGNVELVADGMTIQAAVQAPAAGTDIDHGNVYLLTATLGRPVTLAFATSPTKLSISNFELGLLTAGRLVQIGDPLAGDLTITQAVSAQAGFSKLILGTGGNLIQNANAPITVGSLGLFLDVNAAAPQTVSLTAPGNSFQVFAAESKDTAEITVVNTGDLTVDAVGTIPGAVAKNLTLTTSGNLALANTVSVANVLALTAGGAVTQTAGTVAAGRLTAAAGSVDVTLGGNAIPQVSGTATAGKFLITTATDLEVVAPGITAAQTITLSAGGGKTVTVNAPVLSTGGNAEIIADDAAINDTFAAPALGTDTDHGNVYLLVQTGGQPMALAAAPVAGKFSVSADELARLTAGRLVQLGDNIYSGAVAITQGFTAPAGFSRFLIGSAGDITQDPSAGFVVDSFGVFMADGGAAVADLTAAGNDIRVFAGEGGNTDDITFASTGPLTVGSVGTVVGLTGRTLTVTARSPLTVASDVNGVGDVTLTATDSAAAGDDLTVNPGVTVRSQTGTVTLQAGDNLAVGAGAVLKADAGAVNLLIDFGDADPGVGAAADISKAVLSAPLGVTLTGGPDADTFTVAAAANAAVHVNGLTPSLPTLPGDTLNFVGSGGAVTFTPGATPDKGTFQDGALLPVTFEEIESLNLSGVGSLTVNGTNGPDTLVLFQAGGTTFFQLNGANPVAIAVSQFTFNGLAANDTMIVDYAGGDPVPVDGALFDGTDKAGDVLCAMGAAGFSATYLPDAATTGKGTVTVNGKVISFQNVGDAGNTVGIDVVGFDTATLLTPNANDQLTVANGATFCPPNDPALVVSGKSGLTPITPAAFRGNKTLTLDTETGSAGDDTVTVASADNAHLNTNLVVTTGAGTDAVTVTGATAVAGDILIASKDITVSAAVTAGGGVTLVNAGVLLLNGATVSGNTGVAQIGGGPVRVTGAAAIQSAAGPVSVNSTIDAGVLPASLTITAPSATAGVVALNGPVGTVSRPDSLTVTAGKRIALTAGQYLTGADQTYNGATVVSAATVTFGSTAGKIAFNGTLDGATAGTSNVTVTAPGDTTFGGAVGADKALASLTTDGGGKTVVNGGGVATTGDQSYQDAVVVGKDTTCTAGGKVTFADTLDGGFAVTVTAAGLTTFGGKVGNGTPLASLTVNGGGTTAVNGKLVKTAGDQQYDDAVEVGADATFVAGGKVTFASTLDGGFAVTVTAPGDTTFTGAVGGTAPLASLTTDGGGVTKVAVGVTTAGGQTYDDAVQATGPTVTFASTGGGDIRFNAGLTGATSAVFVNTAGETLFTGGVAVRTLTTDPDGKTRVTGGTVSGTDGLTFLDPVTVDAATTFQSAAGNILFGKTLDGASVTATVAAGKTITFNGVVTVADLTTNAAGGTAVVNTDTVTATTGDLTFNTDVTTGPAVVTFTGKNVTFNGLLTGPTTAVSVNASNVTAFNKAVSVGSLTTNAGGSTKVSGGTVSGTNGLTFLDAVTAVTDTLFQSAAGSIIFNSTLDGAKVTASVSAGQTIVFNDTVTVAALTTLGGASATAVVNTPTVTATGDLLFNTAVTVSPAVVTFTGQNVTFNGPLTGPVTAVTVNAAGLTAFNAAVLVGSLTTNLGGTTAVNNTTVTTVNEQTYNDAFAYSGTVTLASTGGGAITFNGTVTGAAGADLNLITAGDTVFNTGPVNAASLSTDAAGRTLVNTPTFAGTGGIRFNDPVVVQTGVTFSTTGAPLVFAATLDGGFPVVVTANGPVQFFGPVGSITGLKTLTVTGPSVDFASTLDGATDVTVTTINGVIFTGAVGGTARLKSLTLNGPGSATISGGLVQTTGPQVYATDVIATKGTTFQSFDTITIQKGFTSDSEIVLNPQAGVTQEKTSTLTVPRLTLNGAGQSLLDSPQNAIATFQATIGQGAIYLSTAGNLALVGTGVTTAGGDVRIRTGGGFTADGGGANPPARLVNLGATGQFAVFFGLAGQGATATFTAEVTAAKLSIGTPQNGRPTEQPFVAELAALQAGPLGPDGQPLAAGFTPGANVGPDLVEFRPSAATPLFLFGNLPTGADFRVTGLGDTLTPKLDASVVQFTYDGEDGTYVVAGRQLVQFFNFEKLGGASVNAFAVQTAEPGDALGVTSQQFAIRVLPGQSGQLLTGGLDGQRQPDNPFVVSPALVNPAAPTQPPRVAFGTFSGGTLPDLVLANGPGTPSLVTVINGRFLTARQARDGNGQPLFDGNGLPILKQFQFSDLSRLTDDQTGAPAILAQFYAFEPTFQGGVNVAVGNLEGTAGAINIGSPRTPAAGRGGRSGTGSGS